jgi:hypothetical protein
MLERFFYPKLLKLFNTITNTGQTPGGWKRHIIIPLFKNGNKQNPKNYRGINFLNTCYKIFNKIINEKLKQCVKNFFT